VKLNLLFLSSLIATGCSGGPSEDEFAEEAAEVFCAKMFECFDDTVLDMMYEDEEACRESMQGEMEPGGEDDCEYDSKAADECLDAFEDADCADLKAGTVPSECDDDKVCPS
jgi:hypothetical protein